MKLRKILTAAALAVVSTIGMTVPLAAPAAAESCSDVESIFGDNRKVITLRSGAFNMDWKTTGRAAAACSSVHYTYEQRLTDFDGAVYGSNTASGSTVSGKVPFATLRTGFVPAGTTELYLDIRVLFRDSSGVQSEVGASRFSVKVPNYTYDSATGTNASKICTRGYANPCLPILF